MAKSIKLLGTQAVAKMNGIVISNEAVKADKTYSKDAQLGFDMPISSKGMVEFEVVDQDGTSLIDKKDATQKLNNSSHLDLETGSSNAAGESAAGYASFKLGNNTTSGQMKLTASGSLGNIVVRAKGGSLNGETSTDVAYSSALSGNGHYELSIPFQYMVAGASAPIFIDVHQDNGGPAVLTWTESVGNTGIYSVYRGTSSGTETLLYTHDLSVDSGNYNVDSPGPGQMQYIDYVISTGLHGGQTAYYYITASDSNGESAPSNELSVLINDN